MSAGELIVVVLVALAACACAVGAWLEHERRRGLELPDIVVVIEADVSGLLHDLERAAGICEHLNAKEGE